MDARHEDRPPTDQRLFDRLADGELDERQRRALFSSLDSQPDLWRQCALTLLEAQCWRNEMNWLTQQAATCPPPGASAETDDRHRRDVRPATPCCGAQPPRRLDSRSADLTTGERSDGDPTAVGTPRDGRLLALAVGLLLAFSLGIAARDLLSRNGADVEPEARSSEASMAVNAPSSAPSSPHATDIRSLVVPSQPADEELATVVPESTGPMDATSELRGDTITLLVRSGQGPIANQVRVPLVSAKGIRKAGIPSAWLAANQPPLPDRVVRQLEQTGHQVRWQRRYAPVQLDDGRQVVFPVDDIEIAPVAYRPL